MKTAEEQLSDLVETLEDERILLGLTKTQAAAIAHSSVHHWSNITCHRNTPSMLTMIDFANALGLRLELVPMEEERQTHAG